MLSTHNAQHTVTVQASTEHLMEVRDFVASHAAEFGFNKQQISDIRLAVDEAFTNIIRHAYQYNNEKRVQIALGTEGDQFWISLFDCGRSFSMANYKKPDLQEKIKHKKRGGVGVYLIKKLMDNVEYLQQDSCNEIRMIKKR